MSWPSARQRTRSPVRYIRSPAAGRRRGRRRTPGRSARAGRGSRGRGRARPGRARPPSRRRRAAARCRGRRRGRRGRAARSAARPPRRPARGAPELGGVVAPGHRVDRDLGGAVGVEERPPPVAPPPRQRRVEALGADDEEDVRVDLRVVGHRGQERREQVDPGDAVRGGVVEQLVAGQPDLLRRDHRGPAREQRQHHLPDRDVEARRGEVQVALPVGGADDVLLQRDQAGEPGVAHRDALRAARRARGVDDVGERVEREAAARVGGVVVPGGGLLPHQLRVVEAQHAHRVGEGQAPEVVEDSPGGHRRDRGGVADHVLEPVPRVARVHRHVDRAGLEDPEDGHDHLDVALEQHRDRLLGPGRRGRSGRGRGGWPAGRAPRRSARGRGTPRPSSSGRRRTWAANSSRQPPRTRCPATWSVPAARTRASSAGSSSRSRDTARSGWLIISRSSVRSRSLYSRTVAASKALGW